MLRSITWKQFKEWQAFRELEPFGDERRDWQAASICAAIFNAMLISRGSKKRFGPKDWLLVFKEASEMQTPVAEKTPSQSWQNMKQIAKMHVALSKMPDKRGRNGRRA